MYSWCLWRCFSLLPHSDTYVIGAGAAMIRRPALRVVFLCTYVLRIYEVLLTKCSTQQQQYNKSMQATNNL